MEIRNRLRVCSRAEPRVPSLSVHAAFRPPVRKDRTLSLIPAYIFPIIILPIICVRLARRCGGWRGRKPYTRTHERSNNSPRSRHLLICFGYKYVHIRMRIICADTQPSECRGRGSELLHVAPATPRVCSINPEIVFIYAFLWSNSRAQCCGAFYSHTRRMLKERRTRWLWLGVL